MLSLSEVVLSAGYFGHKISRLAKGGLLSDWRREFSENSESIACPVGAARAKLNHRRYTRRPIRGSFSDAGSIPAISTNQNKTGDSKESPVLL